MRLKTPSAKSGQVILETVVVIIGLAAFAVASLQIFSHLNLNMTGRIDQYQKTRPNAINNGGDDPVSYLFYYTHNPSVGTGFVPGFDLVFLEDPNILEASRLMQEESYIINVILPYKISQAQYLAKDVIYAGWDWRSWPGRPLWKFPERLPQVRRLVYDSELLAQQGYDDFRDAIRSFKRALGVPEALIDQLLVEGRDPPLDANSYVVKKPGPFNPNPTLEIYNLENTLANAQRIVDIKAQNLSNRAQIKSVIISLQSAYKVGGGLYIFLYGVGGSPGNPAYAKTVPSLMGYLRFIRENFGHLLVWRVMRSIYVNTGPHEDAKKFLQDIIDYWISPIKLGSIVYTESDPPRYLRITFLDSTVAKIQNIYDAICKPASISDITQSAVISAKIDAQTIQGDVQALITNYRGDAGSPQITLLNNLYACVDIVINALNQAIVHWNNSPPVVGEQIYTYQGKGTVNSVDTSTHKAIIDFAGALVEMDYKILKNEGLRQAQINIWPFYGQTHDFTPEEQARAAKLGIQLGINPAARGDNLIFDFGHNARFNQNVALSAQIESIYSFFPAVGVPDETFTRLAESALYSLTNDSRNGVRDTQYSEDLVTIHMLLNGVAESLKNRLDAALKSWDNEIQMRGQLTPADLAQAKASRDGQLTLGKLDIWVLWRVITDCRYNMANQIVVRNSEIPVPGAPNPY